MSSPGKITLAQRIKSEALKAGFTACGLAPAGLLEKEVNHLNLWLHEKNHGEMSYLERNTDKRHNPVLLAPYTKTVISLAYNYGIPGIPSEQGYYKLARYAYLKDYHVFLKDKINLMMESLQAELGPFRYDCYADSAPVLEKAWAVRAGLGWIGKNSLLLIPHQGSYHFLAEVFTDLEPDYDDPFTEDHCGSCSACIDACPNKAINSNRTINATQCITYHNVENRKCLSEKHISIDLKGFVYGCDICQQACPWNKHNATNDDAEKYANSYLIALKKNDWENLDETKFEIYFRNTALFRAGFNKIKANIKSVRKAMPATETGV